MARKISEDRKREKEAAKQATQQARLALEASIAPFEAFGQFGTNHMSGHIAYIRQYYPLS